MKAILAGGLLAAAMSVAGCGSDSTNGALPTGESSCSSAPSAPFQTVNTGTRALTWQAVPNATSYNLYLKVVANCDMLDSTQRATTADQKFANVSSPFDLSQFNRCHTCYYETLTSVSGSCEGAPDGGAGFALLPCS